MKKRIINVLAVVLSIAISCAMASPGRGESPTPEKKNSAKPSATATAKKQATPPPAPTASPENSASSGDQANSGQTAEVDSEAEKVLDEGDKKLLQKVNTNGTPTDDETPISQNPADNDPTWEAKQNLASYAKLKAKNDELEKEAKANKKDLESIPGLKSQVTYHATRAAAFRKALVTANDNTEKWKARSKRFEKKVQEVHDAAKTAPTPTPTPGQ